LTNRGVFADARSVQQRAALLREEEPTVEEIAVIAAGTKEFREGRFIDFKQLCDELSRRSPD
jgi:hypothetical protein